MHRFPEARYTPILDPRDPASLPKGPTLTAALVPLRPDRARRALGRTWRRRAPAPLWGHYCLPDPVLRRLEARDPFGLGLALDAGAQGIVSMDIPLYGFMTPAQRERAHALHVHRLIRTLERAPRQGLTVVPLVKALDAPTMDAQLDLLSELGVAQAALYARELLLERDDVVLRRFVRGAHRRKLRPLLLGAFTRRSLQWGPAGLASQRHYVLARRGLRLDAHGPPRRLREVEYSAAAGRFLLPGDVSALATHNYAAAAQRLQVCNARLAWGS